MRIIILFIASFVYTHAAMALTVVTTIKPLHSLAAMIMEGSGSEPLLLIDGKQSLHSFSLKPSQMKALQKADALFLISPHFELFLDKMLASAPTSLRLVTMQEQAGITLLPIRMGDGFEAHDHEHHHDHDAHDEEETNVDLHLWSSPANARIMLNVITDTMIALDPKQQTLYKKNLANAVEKLSKIDASIKKRLLPFQNKSFVSFHDASQYFEHVYGLRSVGTITLHPERGTSAKHLSELRKTIAHKKASCVFREPQFDAKLVDNLLLGTSIKSSVIDPEASLLTPSPTLYFELLEGMAQNFEACLG